jgi:hypothetical protein
MMAGGAFAGEDLSGSQDAQLGVWLGKELELGGPRKAETRYYFMETILTNYEEDGTRTPGPIFKLWLEARPEADSESTRYICRKFTVTLPGRREAELPTLADWAYSFSVSEPGIDDQGQVFGIPHKKFAMLVDSRGNLIDSSNAYMVYNAFIDFHGLNDIFVSPMEGSGSVQDLRRIGDRVVHAAANTSAPVGLGEAVKKGSEFRNGEVTLELKGLSMVDGLPCALLGYDSGESSYVMFVTPMSGIELKAEGASHYFGDIYIELGSGWLRKGTLHELVVSLATTDKGKSHSSVIERTISLETMSKSDFDRL